MVIFSLAVLAVAETEVDMVVEGLPKLLKEFDETLLKDDYWRILRWGVLTVLRHLSEEGVFLRKLLVSASTDPLLTEHLTEFG